jgi:peroxiredoxin
MISPQLPEHSRRLVDEKEIPFPLLIDPGNETADAFGVRFTMNEDLVAMNRSLGLELPAFNGDESWSLPIPARFIIDREGEVRYAELDPDYRTRVPPEHTLDALRSL